MKVKNRRDWDDFIDSDLDAIFAQHERNIMTTRNNRTRSASVRSSVSRNNWGVLSTTKSTIRLFDSRSAARNSRSSQTDRVVRVNVTSTR